MKLIRYEHPELSLSNDFDRWFRSMFRDFGSFGSASPNELTHPSDVGLHADFYEAEDAYHASFALPGLTKEDVNVELDNSVLSVKGHFEDSYTKSEQKMSFSRSLAIPDGVDIDKISARMENGMLYVKLPKGEGRKPVSIKVK